MASRYPANTRARDVDRANTAATLDGAFGDGQLSQDEHRAMSELAAGARTLDELEALVGDLQRPADAPPDARPPRETRRHLFTAAVAAAAVIAAVGAFALTDSDDVQAPAPAAQPASIDLGAVAPVVIPTPDLTTREGMTLFIDQYRAKFGDTVVDELNLYPQHANFERAQPLEPNRLVSYDYRGGFSTSRPAATRKVDTPIIDLAGLNVDALADVVAAAPTAINVPDAKVDYLGIDTDGGTPIVRIYASNDFDESGMIVVTPAGSVLRVSPFSG
ncbi:DUF1707 domain-containing protein [Rhodococcus oxybenzonivorans]|uniref:DUF1707 SHOCT-like domain-containing protein n=1 Tax=Rhodococcus oxybenzonivorans TaxID=1990687 RepID=UPI00295347D5|nr:DUF1707 domain-containing protein [Rhodococcus oxybenzonivorans]MDV7355970.1 DUF1707 domain-containing protein [Rhodococcus oxybenzonivorans]